MVTGTPPLRIPASDDIDPGKTEYSVPFFQDPFFCIITVPVLRIEVDRKGTEIFQAGSKADAEIGPAAIKVTVIIIVERLLFFACCAGVRKGQDIGARVDIAGIHRFHGFNGPGYVFVCMDPSLKALHQALDELAPSLCVCFRCKGQTHDLLAAERLR
jgi:hypothetical protein